MKKQYYKVVDEKGRISIPIELRKSADMETSNVVRLCQFGNLIILERVFISETDITEKLRTLLWKEQQSKEAIECYILSALSELNYSQLKEVMNMAQKYML